MIRLTLNAQSDPEIHLFNKSTILMGSGVEYVDLILPGPEIQPIHLKIIEQNGFLIIINVANDPFVSVNGHPFGKKLLNSGDVILVHHTTILFENLQASQMKPSEEEGGDSLSSLLKKGKKPEEMIQQETPLQIEKLEDFSPHFPLPFEKEVEVLKDEEWQEASLESYLKEMESHQELPQSQPASPPQLEQPSVERKKPISLKDDYLRDLDDDNHQRKGASPFSHFTEPSHLYQAWKWILLFIFSLLAMAGMIGTIIYFSVSDKAEAQETKAAQGVADLAMALTHAQLTHLKPHNQNWSDVDFLKSNLQAILPDISSYASQIDAQGRFNCCPYSLRIYTSSDLSHFLLIAQPAPSLWHWLIPKSMITVDSQLMELRMLKDVRCLNRLLANSEPLDGGSGKEITAFIKQGELIRLSTLASESGHSDFAPPKHLAWIHPGCENLIYNAPRYYRLGQSLCQQAINLSSSKGSSQEVAHLKQSVENLSSLLSHFILYAEQGKKSALLIRQSLMTFAPSDKLLFGYLLFDAQGKIQQAHLLKEEEEQPESLLLSSNKELEEVVPLPSSEGKEEVVYSPHDPLINHPIYIQLQTLITARDNELRPLAIALSNLISQELQTPRAQFQETFQNLSHAYLMANVKHKQLLKGAIAALYHQYEEMPFEQFLAFLKELNLEQLIQQDEHTLTVVEENYLQNMENLLARIENSKTLIELDHLIHTTLTWLNLDYIKDTHELIKYQNALRNQVLDQLQVYLLSPDEDREVKSEDRETLQHILHQERLIKPEEREFFLQEFEELLSQHI